MPSSAHIDQVTVGGRSLWSDALRRLLNNRAAVTAMAMLAFVILLAAVGPWLSPYDCDSPPDWKNMGVPPQLKRGHWFGTDVLGNDLFVRTMCGVRVSLVIALVATAVSLIIGVFYGSTAGIAGGRTDAAMMRFVDVMYSMPFIFFVIVLMIWFDGNIFLMFVAIGAVEWLTTARIVRGQTLSLKNRAFVEAARAMGVSTPRIITRHLIPNLLGPVVVYATLTIPQVILFESFLSYLGLGVKAPLMSLGVLIADGVNEMESKSWMLVIPGAFLTTILFCFNFIGDGLRDALDPRDQSR